MKETDWPDFEEVFRRIEAIQKAERERERAESLVSHLFSHL